MATKKSLLIDAFAPELEYPTYFTFRLPSSYFLITLLIVSP